MNTALIGFLIRQKRIEKGWSQEGLCRSICAVSYLSKIEQGKADASRELLQLLFCRLGVRWVDDEKTLTEVSAIIDRAYDAIFADENKEIGQIQQQLTEICDRCENGPFQLDARLLQCWLFQQTDAALEEYVPIFSLRQRTLWMILNDKVEELLQINPIAFSYLMAGQTEYYDGRYPSAMEYLQHAYDLAAREGLIGVMLHSRLLLGNCYSNLLDYERMAEHYRVAQRLANATDNKEALQDIAYNFAATGLEVGHTAEAYDYFSRLEEPSALMLHKLAVCCERLGKTEEALAALHKAETAPQEYPKKELVQRLCGLVQYRLEHADYLRHAEYGTELLACFEQMRRELPSGYAGFHLPWVIEWYKASRQYKQAFELLLNFPAYGRFIQV